MALTTTNFVEISISTLTKATCDTYAEAKSSLLVLSQDNETLGVAKITVGGASAYVSISELAAAAANLKIAMR